MALDLDARQRAMLQEMGIAVWLPPTARATRPPEPAGAPARDVTAAMPQPAVPSVRGPVQQNEQTLSAHGPTLAAQAQTCQLCALCEGRQRSTLSAQAWLEDGTAQQADWFIVGDPPDADEDREGQPFQGQAGQLLDAMLRAVGAQRQGQGRTGAYLSNVVKCHPAPGRVPQPDELAQCARFLDQELDLVRPRLILAMGRFAIQLLLQEHPAEAGQPLGRQRGTVYRYRGLPVVVTYHPKVLLRASADKAKAWADLCLALELVNAD